MLSKLSSGLLVVVLSGNDVMINSKVGDEIVFWMFVHVLLELVISGGLGSEASWEVSRIASWDGFLLGKLSSGILVVLVGGDDIMVNTEVWNKVILWMLVHVLLELLISCGLGLKATWEVGRVACWD